MAANFDSEEEDAFGLLEDSDNDDDYIPDGGHSDSEQENSNKRKASSSMKRSPSKSKPAKASRKRPSSMKSEVTSKKSEDSPVKSQRRRGKPVKDGTSSEESDGSSVLVSKQKLGKSQERKTLSGRKQKSDRDGVFLREVNVVTTMRRSSRSTRARNISYAEAELSDEEMYLDEELVQSHYGDDRAGLNDDRPGRKDQGKEETKERVDALWSDFKSEAKQEEGRLKEKYSTRSEFEQRKSISNSRVGQDDQEDSRTSTSAELTLAETSEHDVDSFKQRNDLDVVASPSASGDHGVSSEKIKKESQGSANYNSDIASAVESENSIERSLSKQDGDAFKNCDQIEANVSASVTSAATHENRTSGTLAASSATAEHESRVTEDSLQKRSSLTVLADDRIKVRDMDKLMVSPDIAAVPRKSGLKRPGGVGTVLESISKKGKVSVLDKSKSDWDEYKRDEGLEDELRTNRGVGFLDKQDFLQRVDYNEWESEREMRLYSTKK